MMAVFIEIGEGKNHKVCKGLEYSKYFRCRLLLSFYQATEKGCSRFEKGDLKFTFVCRSCLLFAK